MDPSEKPEWFVELGSGRIGPFTLEQLMGFYHEGEIPPQTRVFREGNDAIAIEILLKETTAAGMPPLPPEEPEEQKASPRMSAPARPEIQELLDPESTAALFETLQAAKERTARTNRIEPPSGIQAQSESPRFIVIGAVIGLILILMAGIAHWVSSRATKLVSRTISKPAASTGGSDRGTFTGAGRPITVLPPPAQKNPFSYTPPPRPAQPPIRQVIRPQPPRPALMNTQHNTDDRDRDRDQPNPPNPDDNEHRFDQPAENTPTPTQAPEVTVPANPGADTLNSPQFQQVDGMPNGANPTPEPTQAPLGN